MTFAIGLCVFGYLLGILFGISIATTAIIKNGWITREDIIAEIARRFGEEMAELAKQKDWGKRFR
jgi:hypothetical protein